MDKVTKFFANMFMSISPIALTMGLVLGICFLLTKPTFQMFLLACSGILILILYKWRHYKRDILNKPLSKKIFYLVCNGGWIVVLPILPIIVIFFGVLKLYDIGEMLMTIFVICIFVIIFLDIRGKRKEKKDSDFGLLCLGYMSIAIFCFIVAHISDAFGNFMGNKDAMNAFMWFFKVFWCNALIYIIVGAFFWEKNSAGD